MGRSPATLRAQAICFTTGCVSRKKLIFIWTGRGYLVALAIVVDILLTGFIGSSLGIPDATVRIYVIEFLIAIALFVPVWIYGRRWNSHTQDLIEVSTNKRNPHKAFWIPMQYWAIIYPIALVLCFAVDLLRR
jgi:hypothetical protein